jgi:hypothetical protein
MNVHQDDVGQKAGNLLQRLFGGAASADAAATGRFIQVPRDRGSKVRIVLDNSDGS